MFLKTCLMSQTINNQTKKESETNMENKSCAFEEQAKSEKESYDSTQKWVYTQKTGDIKLGACKFTGYSGAGNAKNDPRFQNVKNHGPIPIGFYMIGPAHHNPRKGPFAMHLIPQPGNKMFWRDGFMIHGDSIHDPGNASEGCIVLPRIAREAIAESGITRLEVVSGLY
jgi:hypothetical protein